MNIPNGCEVFHMSAKDLQGWLDTEGSIWAEIAEAAELTAAEMDGWYWWSCFPGCLPDSDPVGPFNTYAEALADRLDTE